MLICCSRASALTRAIAALSTENDIGSLSSDAEWSMAVTIGLVVVANTAMESICDAGTGQRCSLLCLCQIVTLLMSEPYAVIVRDKALHNVFEGGVLTTTNSVRPLS